MTDEKNLPSSEVDMTSDERRVYELGYLLVSTLSEGERETELASLRRVIESKGGTFISDGSPEEITLAYTMYTRDREKNMPHERAFFGWLKFEVSPEGAQSLYKEVIPGMKSILRSVLFKTVKEDTRASVMPATLKDVKRSDTIGHSHVEESKKDVSEAELDKTVDSIVAEIL
ncbi:MAG: hypothetical protein WAX38_00130 [Minisyncoccia bacterium]